MRIAIGQLSQETNTFNPWPTQRADFEAWGVYCGTELLQRMERVSELGGFIQGLRSWPQLVEIVGLSRCFAWPGGRLSDDALDWLQQQFARALDAAGPLDAVLLSLHGALAAEREPDVSGSLLTRIRERIGSHTPLVATLDLHANVTPRMVRAADSLVLFHTAPHIDVFETGVRAANLLRRVLLEAAKPVTCFRKLPLVVPAERANTQDPASVSYALRGKLEELERMPGVLAAGLATVQPWLDVPELGSAVVVVADRDSALASRLADPLAAEVWRRRRDYIPDLTSIDDAIRQARECRGLCVLSDSADATTSGAPGDSTWLLRELLQHDWPRPALVTLVAPEAVEQSRQAGVGAELTLSLGGKRDYLHSQPLEAQLRVERLFEARFILSGHLARNLPVDMGWGAVLARGNVRVVATTGSGPHFAPQLFQAAGHDPFAASVLVAKSPCGFRAAYAERAEKILIVRSPGCAPSDFWNYPYSLIDRPLWPWDAMELE